MCEGKYVIAFLYNIRQLFHFEDGIQLIFLVACGKLHLKCQHKFRKNPRSPYSNIYHHDFIKIMIEDEVTLRNDSWFNILNKNGFNPQCEAIVVENQEAQYIHHNHDEYLSCHSVKTFISFPRRL